ncbi:MOSC and FAD-binding oxidoreductase domain-containing protein [Mycobacterium sp. ACS4331]|uniref:MOSC and FAD-binding oxidoreductase domain-containing protein n=1 Tax=Mycobacterium sp. ACS4331 TaxID=1834121 RepID=UPI0007FDFD61|nr:MOSC and FAD-binding oxidoreductase domain-containing protein [Mycobacterium sp. ACS4331]OBF25133.1 sulfurase [Mycobacterium sp. ACS4331]
MPPRLISVNVGMPADVQWRDRTVHTGIWKSPVRGPVMVRRLNIDGDGQGDLAGHGGEHRAVMVYQQESYEFWRRFLNRDDLAPGSFGENFTISGLADDEVCIGDRFRIGDAEVEVTQPRVTCFRVGLRLGEPRMPQLLVSQRRPGFYLRVTVEGKVEAGDEIVRIRDGRNHMSVADVDALLYLPDRDIGQLRRIVDVPALSPGWQQSFRELLEAHDGGAAPVRTGAEPGWSGFRRLRVCAVRRESAAVLSMSLESDDGGALPGARPGQYLTVRVPDAGGPVPIRSYSLSGDSRTGRYRISVKREDRGLVSRWLHDHADVGTVIEAAAPRGDFHLTDSADPVVLLSAGIGVTPVLAMLNALASDRSTRTVWWLHTVRSRASEAFAAEVTSLIAALPNAHCRVFYTDTDGRLDQPKIAALDLPVEATVHLCGPPQYMTDMREALIATGFDNARIHTELFGALPPIHPGIRDPSTVPRPHPPPGPVGAGPAVTFARSGLSVPWRRDCANILELAEACDVPTRFSCRSGVCHVCATGVVSGSVEYTPQPLELPHAGTALICSAVPSGDVVLDL